MRMRHATYCYVLFFGAAVQVRTLSLKASQSDEDMIRDREQFRARVNDKLIQVNHMVNDLVNDLYTARDRQAPATTDVQPSSQPVPAADANDASSATTDASNALVSDSDERPPDQQGLADSSATFMPSPADNRPAPINQNLSAPALAWLHTPKAGTSFANVVIAWGCPHLLGELSQTHHHSAIANKFCLAHTQDCPTGHSLCSSHSPIDFESDAADTVHSWRQSKGHFVGMFRKPEQRHISGFYDDQLMSTAGVEIYHGRYTSALEYSKANAGCSTKLLAGKPCNDRFNATAEMAEKAIVHLDNGFAFVGLTEEWELSVCLFHRMFGGQCDVREFGNIRPGLDRTDEEYDTSELEGWKDPFDGPLYERAKFKFWSDVAKYDVSWDNCRNSICPGAAQYF